MNRRRVRAAIAHADLDQNVGGRLFGVFHEDIEVAILVENASINQLVLRFGATASPIRLDQITIRKFTLWIFIEHLHVGVGRRTVDVEVVLLDVFAMVPLAVGQAKHSLLEYGILAIPQSEGKAQALLVIAEAGDAVLAPVIGARARLIVGKVAPSVAILAVILPDGSPLALAEIWSPHLPGGRGVPALLKARIFRRPGAIDDWRLGHRLLLPSRAHAIAPGPGCYSEYCRGDADAREIFQKLPVRSRTSTRSEHPDSGGQSCPEFGGLNRAPRGRAAWQREWRRCSAPCDPKPRGIGFIPSSSPMPA